MTSQHYHLIVMLAAEAGTKRAARQTPMYFAMSPEARQQWDDELAALMARIEALRAMDQAPPT